MTQFTFEPKNGTLICDHVPGQYTTVWAKGEDWVHRQPRHYTLCDIPSNNDFTIAVKREPDGLVSSWLHDTVEEGDVLPFSAPYGVFHVQNAENIWLSDETNPVVLLSAGRMHECVHRPSLTEHIRIRHVLFHMSICV